MKDQRLSQVIAVESGIKKRLEEAITALYHTAQKPALFDGMSRIYEPLSAEAEKLPPETKLVQQRAWAVLKDAAKHMAELLDTAATKDMANALARGAVEVDGEVIVGQVPPTFLLTLEKKLTDLHTVISKLPVLDPSEQWAADEADGLFKTAAVLTARTLKVPQVLIAAPATDKHPAQTHVYHDDKIVGYYRTVKSSGALPLKVRDALLERVEKLQKATKAAREAANMAEAPQLDVAKAVFDWIFKI